MPKIALSFPSYLLPLPTFEASMPLLHFPHCFSSFHLSKSFLPLPLRQCSASSSTSLYATMKNTKLTNNGTAVVWFKHDLRIDDHSGLEASASQFHTVVPLYVFDRRILSRFSGEVLEVLLSAIQDLRKSLIDRGSNLMIRIGDAESIIREIVTEVEASNLILEEEVEYCMLRLIDSVRQTMDSESYCDMTFWRTSLYDLEGIEDLPASYYDFKKLRVPISIPWATPTLPKTPANLEWGQLPSIDDLLRFLNANQLEHQEISNPFYKYVDLRLHQQSKDQSSPLAKLIRESKLDSDERNQNSLNQITPRRKSYAFFTRGGSVVGGGTNSVINALAGYLRYLEGTGRDDWQELHEKVRYAETRIGASFGSLFGPSLCLGIVSRGRVYDEAIKYEKDRNGGFLSPFGYSAFTVAAAVETVSSMEWYWLTALNGQRGIGASHSIRVWRWRGHLIQYKVVGHEDEGPSVLLVHGFGASLEHYRDNMNGLAKAGNRVWAITLIGFGKSEKPNVVYTELLWAEMIKDFIDEVVAEPVHLIGNSLGGYISAIVAGLWPTLVKSVSLINSVGSAISDYASFTFLKDRRISGPAWFAAQLLLPFLRSSLKSIVADCYPVQKERADEKLITEMTRASHDPGVIYVLENIFSINLSIPLIYLLEELGENVLVIQGMKDPIRHSKTMLAVLQKHSPSFSIREVDAGHCPHDEKPDEVNSIISQWILSFEARNT